MYRYDTDRILFLSSDNLYGIKAETMKVGGYFSAMSYDYVCRYLIWYRSICNNFGIPLISYRQKDYYGEGFGFYR